MDDLIVKLRVLAKAEAILVRLHLRRAVRQMSLALAAALFGLLALAMLNVSLYLYLSVRMDPALAAFAAAGVDLVIGVAAIIAAGRLELGSEAETAEMIRDRAITELAADAERVRQQMESLGDDIKGIRTSISSILQPGGISMPAVFSWVMMLIGFLRRKRGASD
jgi:hypothetical protein